MSEKAAKANDHISLDVETILQTTEARNYLNQINQVSRVLFMKNSQVEFKGEEILKTGYISDCKSVLLYKCPNGYFLFCNKVFSMNNWSTAATDTVELLAQIEDSEIKKRVEAVISE